MYSEKIEEQRVKISYKLLAEQSRSRLLQRNNMRKKSDKRKRLIDAAKQLIYQQGFNATTLADIGNEARFQKVHKRSAGGGVLCAKSIDRY